jgi:hypothetical protein
MVRRVKRKAGIASATAPAAAAPEPCALCGRALGRRVEWHHVRPKSEGGRATVPLHPICHRAIHVNLGNSDLARRYPDMDSLRAHPGLARFLAWVAGKRPDFHAPTRRRSG